MKTINEAMRGASRRASVAAMAAAGWSAGREGDGGKVAYMIMWYDGGEYGPSSDAMEPYTVSKGGNNVAVAFSKESEAKQFCQDSMRKRNSGSTKFEYIPIMIDGTVDPYEWEGTPD